MGDARTSRPQNAFRQDIGTELSSGSAHTIFYIVDPSHLFRVGLLPVMLFDQNSSFI